MRDETSENIRVISDLDRYAGLEEFNPSKQWQIATRRFNNARDIASIRPSSGLVIFQS